MITRRATSLALASALLGSALPARSFAQTTTPLRIINSDQPGGGMDSLLRPVVEKVGLALGRPIIVDNKPGGQGRIAAQALVQAPADGNTIYIGVQATFVVAPHVYKLPYDPLTDFVPITDLGRGSLWLVTHPSVPAKTLKEVIEWVKSQPPGSVNFASYSPGTISHFGGMLMNQVGGIDMIHVPYKASPDALKDLIPGNVKLMWDAVPTSAGFVKAGRLNPIAFMGSKRLAAFPNVPTVREAGYPDMETDGWIGVFARKGNDPAFIVRLQAEFAKVLQTPEIKTFYGNFGFDTGGRPTVEFQKQVPEDHARWGAFVKKIGYKAEE